MNSASAVHPNTRWNAWHAARNILVVRLDNLGDVLMTTPAIQAIRQSSPQARITLLGSRSGAALARHVPAIDDVITYDAPWVKGASHGDLTDRRLLTTLRRGHFDAAIIFTVCTQSALPAAMMCRLAGIPLRLAHCRENPYDLVTDWVPDRDECREGMRHEVARQLDLVRAVGFHTANERLVFRYAATDVLNMRRKFTAAGGDLNRPYIVVHPGATAVSRRYPAERFGIAADGISRDTGCQVVYSGGHDEQALVASARAAMSAPSISLAGQLTLGELAALIAGAQVTVCNNSGPAHIAAALETPVVVLYALTNPQHTPWRARAHVLNHDVPCRDCLKSTCPQGHHDCLLKVQPDEVMEAALDLIEAPPPVWAPPLPLRAATPALAALG
ncbi:lipopolysaccharide heptosyltransferase II [Piscinibacter gummiphilus]|uniref:lipopolysaccharide heptosyltransferase II n=1 Tax=Piscinibacter gummiphilus TaxID=946333 RepID=A0ABZ0CT93_9BURK|nr:lipopolysaccharide heptosyltransferase II [Piscinibacter gummiphilus]WOB06147.1 lipopolysaccharide heptosyltransferase II [Piscinibacter gummiphilus]